MSTTTFSAPAAADAALEDGGIYAFLAEAFPQRAHAWPAFSLLSQAGEAELMIETP